MKFNVVVTKFTQNPIKGQENTCTIRATKGGAVFHNLPVKKAKLYVGQKLILLTTADGKVKLRSR